MPAVSRLHRRGFDVDDYVTMPLAQIPSPEADWPEILQFALTYNAYRRVARGVPELKAVVQPVLDELKRSGTVPGWAGVDMLRATLFFCQRAVHMNDDYGPKSKARFLTLIGAIRETAGYYPLVADTDLP